MSKTYLLTGATGFLGSLLSLELIKEGHKIIFLGRPKDGFSFKERVKTKLEDLDRNISFDNTGFLEIDLNKDNLDISTQTINKLQGRISALWHLAADLSFKEERRSMVFSANVQGLKNVLNLAEKINMPIYYTSTAFVHGNRIGLIFEKDLIKPRKFNNPYEESKFEAEKIIHGWNKQKKGKFIIFRPSMLVEEKGGAANFFGYYAVLSSLYKLGKKLKENNSNLIFPFPYNKKVQINLMPVKTAVEWMTEIADNPNSRNKTFHITNPHPFSIKNVAKQTFDTAGLGVLLFPAPIWFAKLYFSLFCFFGKFLPSLKKLAQKFFYYKCYMTKSNLYDISNTQKIVGKEKIEKLNFENNFITIIAAEFIKKKLL